MIEACCFDGGFFLQADIGLEGLVKKVHAKRVWLLGVAMVAVISGSALCARADGQYTSDGQLIVVSGGKTTPLPAVIWAGLATLGGSGLLAKLRKGKGQAKVNQEQK